MNSSGRGEGVGGQIPSCPQRLYHMEPPQMTRTATGPPPPCDPSGKWRKEDTEGRRQELRHSLSNLPPA